MAKTIIIIEDGNISTSRVSLQVLKFAIPGDPTITPASVLGETLEILLQMHLSRYNAPIMPMQSTTQH